MNFIHFLSQLTRILFEPYFILILPGALLAVLLNRHRRDRMFYVIAGGVIFMFLWRGCITLLSKRYSEILIFAGICFSVYFLYLFPLWLPRRFSSRLQQYVPKLKRALERCPRLFSRALVLFLVIVSLGKLCRFNRYDDTLPKSCAAVRADAADCKAPLLVEICGETARFQYYTGLPVVSIDHYAEQTAQRKQLKKLLRESNFAYVFLEEKSGQETPAAAVGAAESEWKQIFSAPRDNRKRAYINVYRYRSSGEK